MPFNRPTLPDLISRTEQEISTRLGLGPLLRRSVLGVIARALAGLVHELHGRLAWTLRQAFADTAEAEYLERHGALRDVTRKAATFATGSVTFTGLESTLIGAGTRIVRSDGVAFTTDRTASIVAGSAIVAVTAEVEGAASNTPALTVLSLASSIVNLDSDVTVDANGLDGGADEELDEDLRERVIEVYRTPPQGGSAADYAIWAKEVAGVTRAWGLPGHLGVGTVGVTFLVDNDPISIIPTAAKVTEVQTYIDLRRPATATVTVFAPGTVDLDITVQIVPDTQAVRDAVKASLAELVKRETAPGALLYLSHIKEAISLAPGEQDHTITVINGGGPDNVASGPGEIIVLGIVTFI